MTRAAPYGSAAWRAWKHDHHWASTGTVDPLGAGNTKLLSDLGVTPLSFWDVRRNLTVSGGTASSLADVKGDGTYGPALVQATGAKQPAWDGTTLTFDGVAQYLVSASAISGVDLSAEMTIAIVEDAETSSGKVAWQISDATDTPYWRRITTTVFRCVTSADTNGGISAAATGTGNLRLVLSTINAAAVNVSVEVPTTAKVVHTSGVAMTSGNRSFSIGGEPDGLALAPLRFRAALIWAGGYTTAQRDTLKTWATTYHGAVLA